MSTRTPIEVTASELEAYAFESGREITISSDRATLTIGNRTFLARLPRIPQQRQPEARGPLNTGPTVRVPVPPKGDES